MVVANFEYLESFKMFRIKLIVHYKDFEDYARVDYSRVNYSSIKKLIRHKAGVNNFYLKDFDQTNSTEYTFILIKSDFKRSKIEEFINELEIHLLEDLGLECTIDVLSLF